MPDRSDLPAWLWPRAAYLHVPFCAHHCGYCDFAVTAGQDHLIDLYIEALGEELARLESPGPGGHHLHRRRHTDLPVRAASSPAC